jgi:hypothetical protein
MKPGVSETTPILTRAASWLLPAAFFRDDFLRQLLTLLAARMVEETGGNARVAAARAGLHVESQEHMVPMLFAEGIKF